MKRLRYALAVIGACAFFAAVYLALLGTQASAATTVAPTFNGGTGTSSPSGILYGDNGATNHLNTVTIGSNLTFSGGTLSASGGGSSVGTVSTSTSETAWQVGVWSTTSGYPAKLTGEATGTISASGGVTVTANRYALNGATAIACTAASISAAGCVSVASFNTFNSKVATSAAETAGQLPYWTTTSGTPPKLGSVATSSGSCANGVSCSAFSVVGASAPSIGLATVSANSVLANNTGSSAVPVSTATSSLLTPSAGISITSSYISQVEHRGFSYATSSAWTGTTTLPIESGYGETWNSLTCFTDAGTVDVDFYHGSGPSHLNMVIASTTNGTTPFTTNNVITAADKTYVDIGTPASSPTRINCTWKDTY